MGIYGNVATARGRFVVFEVVSFVAGNIVARSSLNENVMITVLLRILSLNGLEAE